MSAIIINVRLDVKKIEKERLVVGEKGVYLNGAIILFEQPDQFGNDGMIVQDITKQERESGKKSIILGSVKYPTKKEKTPEEIEKAKNDLPF